MANKGKSMLAIETQAGGNNSAISAGKHSTITAGINSAVAVGNNSAMAAENNRAIFVEDTARWLQKHRQHDGCRKSQRDGCG
jgi:uncharacterized protein (DUF2345 family)